MNEPLNLFEYWEGSLLPKFGFGEHVKHGKSKRVGKIIGIRWRNDEEWFYSVDCSNSRCGQWFSESSLVKQ